MVNERLRRFLNLEKPRRPSAGESPSREQERFGNVEPPSPSRPAASTPIPADTRDRFREPGERPLETAEQRDGAQPFTRCARCQMDNTVYAAACQNCGTDLSTPEQRDFNERLWSQRREEAAREQAELSVREQERQRVASAEKSAQLDLVVELARREGQRVREELGQPAWRDDPGASTPWGIRLFGLISNPFLRVAAVVAAVALPLALLILGRGSLGLRLAGMLLLLCLAVLFAPNNRYYRSRRWWWWG
jgi:hypothetical protein